MEGLIEGNIVITLFPFSDLSNSKRRPALVIKVLTGNDIILTQITSKRVFDDYSIKLEDNDFESGTLYQSSFIRPNRLFTADKKIILYKIGNLKKEMFINAVNKIIEIIIRRGGLKI